jgi:hypothetical protein
MRHEFTLCKNATADTHRLQFLKQELIGIRNLNLAEIRCIATSATDPDAILWTRDGNQAAITA